MRNDTDTGGDYDYRRISSRSVFGLALLAAVGAVALLGGAWHTLETATEQEKIAEPPNLKQAVEKIEEKGKELTRRANQRGMKEG